MNYTILHDHITIFLETFKQVFDTANVSQLPSVILIPWWGNPTSKKGFEILSIASTSLTFLKVEFFLSAKF